MTKSFCCFVVSRPDLTLFSGSVVTINLGHKLWWFKTLMAKETGPNAMAISRIWSVFGLKPQALSRS